MGDGPHGERPTQEMTITSGENMLRAIAEASLRSGVVEPGRRAVRSRKQELPVPKTYSYIYSQHVPNFIYYTI